MHHYFEAITNTSGDSLIGYFGRVIDPATQNTVVLSADNNGTPIVTTSGVENMAKTDENGNLSFYVQPGTYHLDIYAPNATSFILRVPNVAMNSSKGDKGDIGDPGPQGEGLAEVMAPTGAALVGFKAPASGSVPRNVSDELADTVKLTQFLGVMTTTAAFQAALNTGKHVRVPAGNYSITAPATTSAPGQRISGDGLLTQITNTSTTSSDTSCIVVVHPDCIIDGLSLTPAFPASGLLFGWGVSINADRCIVTNCHVRGMRRGGVIVSNSNNCTITGNIFTDSVVKNDGTEGQAVMGYDVYIRGTSSYNIVTGNQCISGCGTGIGVQTSEANKPCFGNIISDNIVRNHPCYGIMGGYGFDPSAPVWRTSITGNTIENISGSVNIGGSALFYGCGIYIASAQDFVCSSNIILNTNTDRSLPRSGSDVPAAIGVSGYARGVISDNKIRGCYHGIFYTQAGTAGTVSDGATISGNNISGVDFVGIYVIDAINATVSNNRVIGTATNQTGIHYRNTGSGQNQTCIITDNYIYGFNYGIENNGVLPQMIARGNTIRNIATYGIYSRAAISMIDGNDVQAGFQGIVCTSAVVKGAVRDNVIASPVPEIDAVTCTKRGNRMSNGAIQGVATLVAGAVMVSSAEARTGDTVRISRMATGGAPGFLSVGTITSASGFPINSSSATDTSSVAWEIIH